MQYRPLGGFLLAGVTAALIAAGCGDDDQEASTPSKSEYIADSNAICKETQAQVDPIYKRILGEGKPTAAKAQRFLDVGVVPAIRENVTRRDALTPPSGDEEEVEAIIAAGKEALAGFEDAVADRSRAVALMRGEVPDPATEFDSLSKAYGIEGCGGD
jgi:hypothetical protein